MNTNQLRRVEKPEKVTPITQQIDLSLDDKLSADRIERYLGENFSNLSTISTYRSYIKSFSKFVRKSGLQLEEMKARDVVKYVNSLPWGNRRKSAFCQCIANFYTRQYGASHPAAQAKIKRLAPRPQRYLSQEQIRLIYRHLSGDLPISIRNRAIFGLMLNAAFPGNEIIAMRPENINLEKMVATVRREQGREFEGMFSPQTQADLMAWLTLRSQYVSPGVETLFVALKGRNAGRPLSSTAIRLAFRQIGKSLGFVFSPQDLRRTFIMWSAANGASIEAIRRTGGWVNDQPIKTMFKKYKMANYSPLTPRTILENNIQNRKIAG